MEQLKIKDPFLSPHARLTEGPIFDKRNNILACVDIAGRKVHWWDYTAEDVDKSHKWVSTDSCVSVLGLTNTPLKYIAAVELGFATIDLTSAAGNGEQIQVEYLHQTHTESDKLRFNDGIIDPKGRFFAGSMFAFGEQPHSNGSVYRFDPDGSCHEMIQSVGVPNGMGFSPCGKYMYTTDSMVGKVFKWDYNVETGDLSNKREIISLHGLNKKRVDPDGMSVSTDGSLWVAVWDDYRVVQFSSEGERLKEIELPAQRPSCTAFAGKNLEDLVITAANLNPEDPHYEWTFDQDKGGNLYRLKVNVQGMDRNIFPMD